MTHEHITQKAQNLLACIQHGLHLHDKQSTAAHLGDRSQYIGLSDIGRALECPRAALCNKVFQRPHPSLQKLLTLQRGHWLEYGIGHAFITQGLHALPQLELSLSYNDVPIKAHFDFVLAWATPHPAIRTMMVSQHFRTEKHTKLTRNIVHSLRNATLWSDIIVSRHVERTCIHPTTQ